MNALVRAIVTKAGRRSIVLLDDALTWLTKLPKLPPTSTPPRGHGGFGKTNWPTNNHNASRTATPSFFTISDIANSGRHFIAC